MGFVTPPLLDNEPDKKQENGHVANI